MNLAYKIGRCGTHGWVQNICAVARYVGGSESLGSRGMKNRTDCWKRKLKVARRSLRTRTVSIANTIVKPRWVRSIRKGKTGVREESKSCGSWAAGTVTKQISPYSLLDPQSNLLYPPCPFLPDKTLNTYTNNTQISQQLSSKRLTLFHSHHGVKSALKQWFLKAPKTKLHLIIKSK